MFEIFDADNNDFDTSAKYRNATDNCAGGMTIPESPKEECGFVGLYNQGGTCYLNSSLQIMFMTPMFRKFVFSLPLCNENITIPSDFISAISQGQKYEILLSLQTLFAEMNNVDVKALSTKRLTDAFNWSNGEGSEQQDSQEFIRLLLFDLLERILINTQFTSSINELYQVGYVSKMKCSNCGNEKRRNEKECVLPVQVYEINSLIDSLYMFFGHEEIIEGYQCDQCNTKVDLVKSSKIISLPQYMNIGLNRFTYSYETGERIKITSKFEFPLEIDMRKYCEDTQGKEEDYLYELYGVIVHAGTPYAGHYYAYIRDMTGQGKWNLKPLEKERDEPFEEKEEEEEEEKKEETEKVEEEKGEGKKGKKKKNKGKKQQQQKKKPKSKKEKEEERENRMNYDECGFPLPYTNKSLGENWFEFNDSVITPIRIGRLQKVFKSKTSAYMLFYSKKSNSSYSSSQLSPPQYLQKYTDELNANLSLDRAQYEIEKNSLLTSIYSPSDFTLIENSFITLLKNAKPIEKKIQFTDKISSLFPESSTKSTLYLFDFDYVTQLITIIKKIPFDAVANLTIKDCELYHKSHIVIIQDNEDNSFNCPNIKIGTDYEPVALKMYFNGKKFDFIAYLNDSFDTLKSNLQTKLGISDIQISFTNPSGKEVILDDKATKDKKTNISKTVKQLNLHNKTLITLSSLSGNNGTNLQSDTVEKGDEINCLIRFEYNEDDVQIITVNLLETFGELEKKVKCLLPEEQKDSPIRLRCEMTNKLIQKSQFESKISTDPMFVEGDVRIKVEYGEVYKEDEILIYINLKNSANITMTKTFIGNPQKVTIETMKKVIVSSLNEENAQMDSEWKEKSDSEFALFKVDMFDDPIKAIKNETDTLSKCGIQDKEVLWLRPTIEILSDTAFIEVYQCEANYYDLKIENFVPVEEKPVMSITIPKMTAISAIKQEIINKVNENKKENLVVDISNTRLRLIGKFGQPERVLKSEGNTQLKKYNPESPVKVLFEILSEKEIIPDNQIMLILMTRNIKTKTYTNKKIIFLSYENNSLNSECLYKKCREYIGKEKISIAKHVRGMYTWEPIKEFDEKGKSLNLRKGQITLRDSDWIGVRDDSESESDKDDFRTEFDIMNFTRLQESGEIVKGKKTKRTIVEKPLRINLIDE